MLKKMFLVLMISALILSISGCTDKTVNNQPQESTDNVTDNNVTDNTDKITVDTISEDAEIQNLVPVDSIPEGYEFLGSHNLTAEYIGNEYISFEGINAGHEGLYMYNESTNAYIDIVEFESQSAAENFITGYMATFDELKSADDRFTDTVINDHSAVQILEYETINSETAKRYTYIWNNGRYVFVVGGATDNSTILKDLAEATGY